MFPGKVALKWSVCPWAFLSGWGQNKKLLARDTSPSMQATVTDPAAIPLQCISHAPVTKSSPGLNFWTRLGIQDPPEEGILSMHMVAYPLSQEEAWCLGVLQSSLTSQPSVVSGQRKPWSPNYSQCFLFPWSKVVKILGIVFAEEQPYAIISVANKFLLTAKLKGNSFANLTAARPPGEVLGPSTLQILMLKMQALLLVLLSIRFLEMAKILFYLLLDIYAEKHKIVEELYLK